jgi:hypothetical protein
VSKRTKALIYTQTNNKEKVNQVKPQEVLEIFKRDLAPRGAEFEDLHAESKPSSERSSESLNLIFFLFF